MLSVDTIDPVELEGSCESSLLKDCAIKGTLEDCSDMMAKDVATDETISQLIGAFDSDPIAVDYVQCVTAMVVSEDGAGVPGDDAKGIGEELELEGFEVFVFGENATMDEVLHAWRDRR